MDKLVASDFFLEERHYGTFFESFRSTSPDATISVMGMLNAMKTGVRVVLNLLAKQHYTNDSYAKFSHNMNQCADAEVVKRARSWVTERNESAHQKQLSLELSGKQFGVVADLFKNLRCLNHLIVTNDLSLRSFDLNGWNHVKKVTVIQCPHLEKVSGVLRHRQLDLDLSRQMF